MIYSGSILRCCCSLAFERDQLEIEVRFQEKLGSALDVADKIYAEFTGAPANQQRRIERKLKAVLSRQEKRTDSSRSRSNSNRSTPNRTSLRRRKSARRKRSSSVSRTIQLLSYGYDADKDESASEDQTENFACASQVRHPSRSGHDEIAHRKRHRRRQYSCQKNLIATRDLENQDPSPTKVVLNQFTSGSAPVEFLKRRFKGLRELRDIHVGFEQSIPAHLEILQGTQSCTFANSNASKIVEVPIRPVGNVATLNILNAARTNRLDSNEILA